jgi:IS30 family transposase
MARPRIEIDKSQFEKLCSIQCTQEEIAGFFNCSPDTVERWCKREYEERFAEIYAKKRGLGKISLRRSQFRMAETNPSMAIWLGKQYLGQKEPQQEIQLSHDDDTIREMNEYFNQKTNSRIDME